MNKAIFLDRDGVVNESHTSRVKFVNKPEDMYILPRVADSIAILRQEGYKVFVVTNQGGMHYGYMSVETLDAIHQEMRRQLLEANPNAIIDDISYCPHNPKGDCECRKPKPGMLLQLAEKYDISLRDSWMVGDMESDVEAGAAAGCGAIMLDESIPDLYTFADRWIKDKVWIV